MLKVLYSIFALLMLILMTGVESVMEFHLLGGIALLLMELLGFFFFVTMALAEAKKESQAREKRTRKAQTTKPTLVYHIREEKSRHEGA